MGQEAGKKEVPLEQSRTIHATFQPYYYGTTLPCIIENWNMEQYAHRFGIVIRSPLCRHSACWPFLKPREWLEFSSTARYPPADTSLP